LPHFSHSGRLSPEASSLVLPVNSLGSFKRALISPAFLAGFQIALRAFSQHKDSHVPEHFSCNGRALCVCDHGGGQVAPSSTPQPLSPPSWSPSCLPAGRAAASLVRVVHARASRKRSGPFIQSRTVMGPLWVKRGRSPGRRHRGVAPSRRENCRPGKRPVDHSKRQRWPRRTDPAPIHRRRHRIPARLKPARDGIANTEGRLRAAFLPVTLAWCEPCEPLVLGAPHPAYGSSFIISLA
jgi:hypothetical protein